MKNPCCSCEYRGDLFKLGDGGIPHCHCHHPSVPEKDFGWGSLREGFWTCKNFKRRLKAVENRQAIAQQMQAVRIRQFEYKLRLASDVARNFALTGGYMAADPVLRFMVKWFAKHDVPPTVRQVWMAAQLEVSRKTVRSAVQHVKPKMPSYKEFDEYCHSINVDGVQSAYLYRYFARHFGR